MTQKAPDPARRRLLARTRDVTAAAAATAVLGPATSAAAPVQSAPAEAQAPRPRGYHETDRTRRYYDLARF